MVITWEAPTTFIPLSLFFAYQRRNIYTNTHPHIYLDLLRNGQVYSFGIRKNPNFSSRPSLQKHKFPLNISAGDEERLWCLSF